MLRFFIITSMLTVSLLVLWLWPLPWLVLTSIGTGLTLFGLHHARWWPFDGPYWER